MLTIARFLKEKGILDGMTRLRVQSWTVRPREKGAQVDERTNGSMAHTAGSIITELAEAGLAATERA